MPGSMMKPKEAIELLKRVRAFIHPQEDPAHHSHAVQLLEEYTQRLEDVVEQARSQICLRDNCQWGLCRAVRDLDRRFPDEPTSPSNTPKRNDSRNSRRKTTASP